MIALVMWEWGLVGYLAALWAVLIALIRYAWKLAKS